MTTITPNSLIAFINRAELAGFAHYAQALRHLYAKEFGPGSPKNPHKTQLVRQAKKESHDPFSWGGES